MLLWIKCIQWLIVMKTCVLCHRKSWALAIQTSCLSLVHLLGAIAPPPVAAAPQPLPLPQAARCSPPPLPLPPLHLLIKPVMCRLHSSRCLPPPLRPPLRSQLLPQPQLRLQPLYQHPMGQRQVLQLHLQQLPLQLPLLAWPTPA